MSGEQLVELAQELARAWERAEATSAPSTSQPSLTVQDAYSIQELVIEQRLKGGRRRTGWKMGLTSAEPPATPIVGTLLSDMVLASGSELEVSTMVAPMVEAELVVRIGETIDRPQTVGELAQGPNDVAPGIEIIDYRTTNSSGVVDWIADNSTVAYAVVGDFTPLAETSPAEIEASLHADGKQLATGKGSLVMGHPLAAVAWLSEHLIERGRQLEGGHIILTGSLTGHHPVPTTGTSQFEADFGVLGSVTVRFNG